MLTQVSVRALEIILAVLEKSGGNQTVPMQHLQAITDLSCDKHLNSFLLLRAKASAMPVFVMFLNSYLFVVLGDAPRQLESRDSDKTAFTKLFALLFNLYI